MKGKHRWDTEWIPEAQTWRFLRCRACGQDHRVDRPTLRCVCWKLRLPKRTKETKQ